MHGHVDTRHIEKDDRKPNLNPFFVSTLCHRAASRLVHWLFNALADELLNSSLHPSQTPHCAAPTQQTFLTIFATPHTEWEIEDLPYNLRVHRSQIYSDDQPDRRVDARHQAKLYAKYGIDLNEGCIVVVRPDGYVGASVTLSDEGCEALEMYFAGFLKKNGGGGTQADMITGAKL